MLKNYVGNLDQRSSPGSSSFQPLFASGGDFLGNGDLPLGFGTMSYVLE